MAREDHRQVGPQRQVQRDAEDPADGRVQEQPRERAPQHNPPKRHNAKFGRKIEGGSQPSIKNFISPKPDKFTCDECGFSTNLKSKLIDHVNRVHLKINDEPSINQSGNHSELTPLVPLTPKGKRQSDSELSPGSAKRKKLSLSITEKQNLIRKYDKLGKMTQESAANILKIPRPSLIKILKNRDAIMASEKSDVKRNRVGKDAMVEDALIQGPFTYDVHKFFWDF